MSHACVTCHTRVSHVTRVCHMSHACVEAGAKGSLGVRVITDTTRVP